MGFFFQWSGPAHNMECCFFTGLATLHPQKEHVAVHQDLLATQQLTQRITLQFVLFSKEYLFSLKELLLHAKKMKVGAQRETSAFYQVLRK